MRVLAISGDRSFGPGHPRFELQKSAVEELTVVYWGRGSMWPKIPAGHFDVVTVQDPFWRGLFALWVARRLGAKLNVQVHTDLSGLARGHRLRTALRAARPSLTVLIRRPLRLAAFVLRRADSVRVVSEKIKNQINHPRIHVLPVYVDSERFKTVERHADPNTILWVGRFEEEKDPLYALEVIAQVPGARLVMLGSGSLESRLKEKAKGLPVEFAGWQDPLPYLTKAAVVLSTSRHESWGASIVEALAAGVPVVAPDVGVAKEAGAIVVPREQLAEKVIEVLQNGVRGELKLKLLTKDEWVRQWRETLI